MLYFIDWSNIHDDRSITDGPFPEFIQLTHEEIRVGPEGDSIGYFYDGDWHRNDDESGGYTDLVVYAK